MTGVTFSFNIRREGEGIREFIEREKLGDILFPIKSRGGKD